MIEYSDNYSDTSGRLLKIKKDEPYINFCRSLEMLLINCKINLELNWTRNCVMFDIAGETTFKITNTKLYSPIVTLSTKDNVKLTKQSNEGFKRPVYWNGYKSKIDLKDLDNNEASGISIYLDALFQGVDRLFFLLLTILIMVQIS